jgi:hypothetical protein
MLKIPFIVIAAIVLILPRQTIQNYNKTGNDVSVVTIDGPYVLYVGDTILVHYIDSVKDKLMLRTQRWQRSQPASVELHVNTDEPGKTFTVKLKSSHTPEKPIYNRVRKMLVLSDIEGEFEAMRKLLQGNGVIDKDYNWTYGDGHLVLVGDFVDRGTMVTELLWLIYSLESRAEAMGGKVHFILGNHEVMNMNGEHGYVHHRYLAHADTMKLPYLKLFGAESELGRWLANKNVTERINNILFTHGGYSRYMNMAQMELRQINDTSRLYYTDTSMSYPSVYSELIFGDEGPFWYRGYYYGKPRASMSQVDSTLDIYNCRYIVTGHTVVAKEILSLYDGKVINTDVPHKHGHSEALLVEEKKMFRVNEKGERKEITVLK